MTIIKDLQRQYEILKSEKETSDKRTIELETLVGKQAIQLEDLRKECEKEKEVMVSDDAETVRMKSGKVANLIKPSDQGTFVKKAIMKVPAGVTYMIMEGEYAMVPCATDGNLNTLKVTKKEDGIKQIFEFAEAQMPTNVSGN